MTKDEIRKDILTKRNSLTSDRINEKSRLITRRIIETNEYKEAENILIYSSMGSEVRTDEIIIDSLSNGKEVFCPKVTDKKNGQMSFARIKELSELKKGYFGIREPIIDENSEIFDYSNSQINCEKSLVIVPGVAFDKSRNRIGYKGGFYDRFLQDKKNLFTIALAFEEQICEHEIPVEAHDIKPSVIITDTEVLS